MLIPDDFEFVVPKPYLSLCLTVLHSAPHSTSSSYSPSSSRRPPRIGQCAINRLYGEHQLDAKIPGGKLARAQPPGGERAFHPGTRGFQLLAFGWSWIVALGVVDRVSV